jgi:regulator of protease activity HflC (stomatin/prohibitin superfamily)
MEIAAEGKGKEILARAQKDGLKMITDALADGATRIGEALEESSQFIALGRGLAKAPNALKLRLWYEALETVLADKHLIVVDASLAEQPGGIMFDERPNAMGIDVLQQ